MLLFQLLPQSQNNLEGLLESGDGIILAAANRQNPTLRRKKEEHLQIGKRSRRRRSPEREREIQREKLFFNSRERKGGRRKETGCFGVKEERESRLLFLSLFFFFFKNEIMPTTPLKRFETQQSKDENIAPNLHPVLGPHKICTEAKSRQPQMQRSSHRYTAFEMVFVRASSE